VEKSSAQPAATSSGGGSLWIRCGASTRFVTKSVQKLENASSGDIGLRAREAEEIHTERSGGALTCLSRWARS